MSEFTKELRELQAGDSRWDAEVEDLLDALDARLRALEGDATRAVGLTKATIGASDPAIVRDVHADAVRAAVLAERERCARVAELRLWQPLGENIAAEIRKGA